MGKGGDRLELFRSAGLGELRITLRIKQLAMQDQNLGVAKDMVIHATKIMDLVNPALDLADGFEIRVKRAEEAAKPTPTGPDRVRIAIVEKKARVTDWYDWYIRIYTWTYVTYEHMSRTAIKILRYRPESLNVILIPWMISYIK